MILRSSALQNGRLKNTSPALRPLRKRNTHFKPQSTSWELGNPQQAPEVAPRQNRKLTIRLEKVSSEIRTRKLEVVRRMRYHHTRCTILDYIGEIHETHEMTKRERKHSAYRPSQSRKRSDWRCQGQRSPRRATQRLARTSSPSSGARRRRCRRDRPQLCPECHLQSTIKSTTPTYAFW